MCLEPMESGDNDEEAIRNKEQEIMELGEKYKKEKKAVELAQLIRDVRPFLAMISKAKAAKLVRGLVDLFLDMEAATGTEVQLCKVKNTLHCHTKHLLYFVACIYCNFVLQECISWAVEQKGTFLRQSLEARLIALYFDTKQYSEALALGATLLKELKKLDDKYLLVEVSLSNHLLSFLFHLCNFQIILFLGSIVRIQNLSCSLQFA